MQINMAARDTTGGTSGSSNSTSTSTTSNTDALANKSVFLQMLVAQIQNQDPLNPTDSSTFMTQLAQFSSLEQLIGIKTDLDSIQTNISAATTTQTA